MKITLLSCTHTKHNQVTEHLPGGELLIHAGDFMNSGYSKSEAIEFFEWFDNIPNYETKIFIGGNHDRLMQNDPEWVKNTLPQYKTIDYREDEELVEYSDGPNGDWPEENIRIYGSPWQPEFCNWAFNLPRNGEELKAKWNAIPWNTDILVTHTPAWGTLDDVEGNRGVHLGCELLAKHINEVSRPKIHVCGHIHSGYGYYFNGQTHYFNASVLNEQYNYTQKPFTFDWEPITNTVNWLY